MLSRRGIGVLILNPLGVGNLIDRARALLVGHEPHLGYAASVMLTGKPSTAFPFKKAGACLIEVSTPSELGGRNLATATVSWRDGREETDEPTALVQKLAAQYNGEVPELTVKRPTLEDVYLKMIGER